MSKFLCRAASSVVRSPHRPVFSRCTGAIYPQPWRRNLSYEVSAADLQFGQPVHETHPHLVGVGDVTPEISAQEYADRREKFANLLSPGSVALLPSATVKYRSGPVFHRFQQDTNFFYLTGFEEPESVAIIDTRPDHPQFTLLVREKDPKEELWEGARSGTQAAQDVFNADEAHNVAHIASLLPKILDGAKTIFTDVPASMNPDASFDRFFAATSISSGTYYLTNEDASGVAGLLARCKAKGAGIKPVGSVLAGLRVMKSEAEVRAMRYAGQQAGRAHTNAMRKEWQDEKKLAVFLRSEMMGERCEDEAYIPVVAGGRNALSIHYVQNNALLRPDEMILVDAGAQYGGYISDITRTWPNSGKFSPAQRDLYQMILNVQRSCVSLCREDSGFSLDKLHKTAEASLKTGLKDLGIDVSGDAMNTLFPHHLSHYIGLDVHDTPSISRTKKLETGMCVTIEPGVYIPDDERWPAHFRGMGIRIEDSIYVDKTSPLILTTEAVKEIVDIEALRS